MVVAKHEKTLDRILGKPSPLPKGFQTLQPRTLSLRSSLDTWYQPDPGQSPQTFPGTGWQSWTAVTSDSRVGDFVNPTYHEYNVSENRRHVGRTITYDGGGRVYHRREGPYFQNSYNEVLVSYDYPLTSATDSSIYNQALEKLNEKTRGSIDLSIDLLQSRQALKMTQSLGQLVAGVTRFAAGVVNPFRLVYNLTRIDPWRLKRTETYVRLLRDGSKSAANRWLEWQYGVRPLASTIYSSVENMLDQARGSTRKIIAQHRVPLSKLENWQMMADGVTCRGPLQVRGYVGCRFEILFHDQDPGLAEYTSLNPASILWETLPFSFVYDWVHDIGSYLRNAETSYLYANRFRGGYVTQFRFAEIDFETSGNAPWSGGGRRYVWYSGSTSWRYRRRTVLTSYPAPIFPRFDVKLGSSRLLSAAALLRGVLR